MAKDYGSRKPTRHKTKGPKQLFWILASYLFGYLTATVFDFTSLTSWVNTNILTKRVQGTPVVQVARKEPELPKPKFEFYTLLAKDHTNATAPVVKPQPVVAQTKPAAKPVEIKEAKAINSVSFTKESYQIQLAAFKNRQDAEHMKAALTLKGFDVRVIAAVNWFRVIAGPFGSRVAAEKAQLNLAQNERIKGLIRKVEV